MKNIVPSVKRQLVPEGSRFDRFMTRQFSSELFSWRQIFSMLGPLILDQFFVYLISMLTTSMISSSGQDSVSAVSLVGPITMLLMSLCSAISAGGTVIVAQYKGRGDDVKMHEAAGQVVMATCLITVTGSILLAVFSGPLIGALFGSAEPIVQQKAIQYLIGFGISMIPFSLYQGAFSVMRGVGDTKTCLRLTVIINFIHLFASMLFINVLQMDIWGTSLSYIIARIIGGGAAIYLLMSHRGLISIRAKEIFRVDFTMLKSIFRMGVPFAIEQIFFNGGTLIVQTYMVQLGTACIAANAIANSAVSLFYGMPFAVGTLSITIVGQCVGAKMPTEARRYSKRMFGLGTILSVISVAVLLPLMPLLLSLYRPEAAAMAMLPTLVLITAIPMPFVWSMAYVMPSALRAAGDANFGSAASLIIMWVFRVGLGYLLAIPLGFGINGVWVAMVIEWAVRAITFGIRFHGKAWLTKKAID